MANSAGARYSSKMYTAETRHVRVTVEPEFSTERSEPSDGRYFWIYSIEISNLGEKTVQLTHRHWRIVDAAKRSRVPA